MHEHGTLGPHVELEVRDVKADSITSEIISLATEIPFTIVINEQELATLLCTPEYLKELTYGFLYTSGIIHDQKDVTSFALDTTKWIGYVQLGKAPDFHLLSKRVYTAGCGKGIMYSSFMELASRRPVETDIRCTKADIQSGMHFLLQCSPLYKKTGSIHTVGLASPGKLPDYVCDDIGRHNALDKVIGRAMLEEVILSQRILFCTGRISSEMLHKAKRCNIPVLVSRGAATHQAVLRARSMGITLIGSVRVRGFKIFSHPERIGV
ncbi:MAG: formate dehydrogenase accessory sulfurtransferase FdhD [Spirochaetales bacterium]|nr:formate dehydrogenase accessory sulfurtransferase FdhD [Spirochaetales bacterium]